MTRNWLVRFDHGCADLAAVGGVLSRWAQGDRYGRSWHAHSAGIVRGAVLVEASSTDPQSFARLELELDALEDAQLIAAVPVAPVAA